MGDKHIVRNRASRNKSRLGVGDERRQQRLEASGKDLVMGVT